MMKKKSAFVKIFAILLVVISHFQPAIAQDDLDKLLTEGIDDSKYLIRGYLTPFMESLGQGLNQGWYNTAKPHKLIGVDLTITANMMFVPSGDRFFNIDNNKLETIQRLDAEGGTETSGKSPTIVGPDNGVWFRTIADDSEFRGPGGIDLKKEIGMNAIPVPMATLGIGLPKGTDLKFRFTPSIDLGDDGSFKLFGIGVMHDVKQWIPGIKMLPFDLSGFIGYTNMKLDYLYNGGEFAGNNQRGEFSVSSTTIQGIVSKKFSVLTVYGAAGYNIAKSNIALKGTFDLNDDGDVQDPNEVNPLSLDFKASGPRMTAGFRLKLAVFTLHADYTLQKYNALTVGFGINVR